MKNYVLIGITALVASSWGPFQSSAAAQQKIFVKPVVEKRVKELPTGPLYWRLENFATLDQAQAAAGATSLAAEVLGNVWLFTLGAKGGATPGGTRVIEIGPVPTNAAPEYLLRINHAGGPPGAKTSMHSHPGSESFYVVSGRLGQTTPHGASHVTAGQSLIGHGADTPMQVFNDGDTDLEQLVMFVVDAARPFSTPWRDRWSRPHPRPAGPGPPSRCRGRTPSPVPPSAPATCRTGTASLPPGTPAGAPHGPPPRA
jgi:quercetin dioxygenase-like cupin family protein